MSIAYARWEGLGVGLLLCAALGSSTTAAEDAAGHSALAVVDVSKVFKNYMKVFDVQRQVEGDIKERKKALDEERKILLEFGKKVKEMRETLDGNNERLFEVVQQFQKMQFQYERKLQRLEEDLGLKMREEMKNVLNEIRAAIRKEAERLRFDIVLRAPDADDPLEADASGNPAAGEAHPMDAEIQRILTPTSTLDLVAKVRRNPVLFGAKTVDITDSVLTALNADYLKKGGRPPGTVK